MKRTIEEKNHLNEFENPSARFRGAPFWAWNCRLEKEQLLRQIDTMKRMGLGGYTMHCRTGLDTPYMGPEFMEMIRACVEKAREEDMLAYLYDEDRWPSGFGGGEVTKDAAFRSRYLLFTPTPCEARGFGPGDDDSCARAIANGGGTLLAAYDVTLRDGVLAGWTRISADDAKPAAGAEASQLPGTDAFDGSSRSAGLDPCEDANRSTGAASTAQVCAAADAPVRWYAYLEISGDSSWFNNQAYVNTLDRKAIERFIETTHDRYVEAVGADFGGVIPSIFTDEPQFTHKTTLGFAEAKTDVVLPWTDDLEETFHAAYGHSLLDSLPEVVWELPENRTSVVRYRYHDHIAERFACAFSDTVGAWCRAHGIALTGHMMEEPTLQSQTAALGEAMRHYRGFDVPGIDMLCNWYEWTTAKQAQSAAHQMGVPDVLSELYGVTNWDFDFRGHKAQGDWQAALGVTRRVHHLSWVSMGGEAKRDYPASMLHQSPWHDRYPMVENHFARVNTALTSGRPDVRIGVVHPVESYWLSFGPEEQTAARRRQMQTRFDQVTQWLLFGLMDFDFVSESLMLSLPGGDDDAAPNGRAGRNTDIVRDTGAGRNTDIVRNTGAGRNTDIVRNTGAVLIDDSETSLQASEPPLFQVGSMAYDVLVVPGCRTLRSTTVTRLDAFVRRGGTVLFLGERPELTDAAPAELPPALREAACIAFDEIALLDALAPWRLISLRDDRGRAVSNRLSQMRRLGNDAILFLAPGKPLGNTDVPVATDCTLQIRGLYAATELDTLSGSRRPLSVRHRGGDTFLACRFYPHDSLLLQLTAVTNVDAGCTAASGEEASRMIAPDAGEARPTDASPNAGAPADEGTLHATLSDVSAFHLEEPNVLVLDQAEVSIDGGAWQPLEEILRIDAAARRTFGYSPAGGQMAQPWTMHESADAASASANRDESPTETSGTADCDPHTVSLRYALNADIAVTGAMLAIERPDRCRRITLNGVDVPVAPVGTWVDDCFHTLALPSLPAGRSELVLRFGYHPDSSLEASFLLGHFGVRLVGRTAHLAAEPDRIGFGSLTTQGYPFYGGNVSYALTADLPEGDWALSVAKFKSPVLSVTVDGTPVGEIAWAPYRVQLGHLAGRHEIVVTACGSRVNTFGCMHNCDENWEWFGPHSWRTEGSQFCYEYRLKETGILTAPMLYRMG